MGNTNRVYTTHIQSSANCLIPCALDMVLLLFFKAPHHRSYYIKVNSMQGMIYMYVHQEAGMQPNKEEVLGLNVFITVDRRT